MLGVWQDVNTLQKRTVFKSGSDIKKADSAATLSVDKSDEDDIQIIKVVESHQDEISRSGNTSEYLFLPSCILAFNLFYSFMMMVL